MKQLIAGGFLFIGGCILYAVGTLGFADSAVGTSDMQAPMYIGIVVMLAGITMGILGLQKKD
jgi:formate hydrogenlyase subunit 3/multisubunit Na+/H+ antiporter MnhD subunit